MLMSHVILMLLIWFGRHCRLATLLNKLKDSLRCEVPSVMAIVDGSSEMSLTSHEISDVNLNKVPFQIQN